MHPAVPTGRGRSVPTALLVLGVLGAASLLPGCLGGPAIDASPGLYEFVHDANGTTGSWTRDWANDEQTALAAWDMTMAEGTVTVAIQDDAASQVLRNTFEGGTDGRDLPTDAGNPGTWRVTVELADVTGPVRVTVRSG